MKRLVLFICLVSMAFGVRAATKYRDFTSADGKTIRAAVKAYDAKKKIVTIERDNRKTAKVPITVFSEADQAYIMEWDAAKGFSSDRSLKVTCDKKRVDQRKEKEWRDVRFVGGGSEKTLLKETSFESLVFDVQFRNMNKSALKNIRMEYIVYYEQSEISINEEPVAVQNVLKEEIPVPVLDAGKNVVVSTKPVEVYHDNINAVDWADGSVYIGGEGEIHGFRARLYMKMPSGNEIMREFSYPEKLSDAKFPWKD